MPNTGFPKPVGEVMATLADICRHQGSNEILELLNNAHSYFDDPSHDNWNGGTDTWPLRLEVPVPIYFELRNPI